MGGTAIATDEREAASGLRWWLEMGVDVAIDEQPRNWLEGDSEPVPEATSQPAPADSPDTLEAFRLWLASAQSPLSTSRSKPVLPVGAEGAEVMVLADLPTREELASSHPVGGEAGELLRRMLAAIGMADTAYIANLACFHSPAGRLSDEDRLRCADAARKHVALARPARLLLIGDEPCRVLLDKPLLSARGHVHKVEGVRTVATFHPRQLLKRPSDKALAWQDLLLLTEEQP